MNEHTTTIVVSGKDDDRLTLYRKFGWVPTNASSLHLDDWPQNFSAEIDLERSDKHLESLEKEYYDTQRALNNVIFKEKLNANFASYFCLYSLIGIAASAGAVYWLLTTFASSSSLFGLPNVPMIYILLFFTLSVLSVYAGVFLDSKLSGRSKVAILAVRMFNEAPDEKIAQLKTSLRESEEKITQASNDATRDEAIAYLEEELSSSGVYQFAETA